MENKDLILAKLQEDEGFLQAIVSAKDAAEAKKVLSEHNIDLSIEEVEALFQAGQKELTKYADDAELSEEDLTVVTGGGWVRGIARLTVAMCAVYGYSLLLAAYPPAVIAAPGLAGGLGLWVKAGLDKKGW